MQEKKLGKLRKEIGAKKNFLKVQKYFISLPDESAHSVAIWYFCSKIGVLKILEMVYLQQ